jgi:hypothetical protein
VFDEFAMEVLGNEGGLEELKESWKSVATLYRSSSGWTAIAVSPNMVSGRVVATTIL